MEPTLVALNPQDHATWRLKGAQDECPHFVEIVASEFSAAAAVCPIFFTKNTETGAFYPGAMFGFRPGENLVAVAGLQQLPFEPLNRQREGFFVSGDHIAVDAGAARFSEVEGEPLFEGDGGAAPALRRMQQVLTQLVTGQQQTAAFTARLVELRLLEPIDITLDFDDGERMVLEGLYTIGIDALSELDDAQVLELFRSGLLQHVHTVIQSTRRVGILAAERNRRLAGA